MNKNEIISKVKFSLLEKYDASGMDDEFINDCIDKTLEAINYSQCSTQLKFVYTSDFVRWLETGFTYYEKTSDFLCHKGHRYSFRELVSRYNRSHALEALIV